MAVARDIDHRAARAIQSRMIAERRRLVTTNYVLAELHALLLARVGRRIALTVILDLIASETTMVRVGEDEERRALEILRTYADKDFTFVDATSFAVMERLGITQAFTFDRHFGQYGFQVVRAAE